MEGIDYYQEDILFCVDNLKILSEIEPGSVFYITGSTGMIGKFIIKVLMTYSIKYNIDIKIIAVSRSYEKICKEFECYLSNKNFEYIIYEEREIIPIPSRIDYLIHAASPTGHNALENNSMSYYKTNILDTCCLLNYVKEHSVKKFLFLSSAQVYNKVSGLYHGNLIENMFDQSVLNIDNNIYAFCKQNAELLCKNFLYLYKLPILIVRPFHMYGPGMDVFRKDTMIYEFFNSAVTHHVVQIKTSGKAKRNFCYLRDSIIAILLTLLSPNLIDAINLGNFVENQSIVQFSQKLMNNIGSVEFEQKDFKIMEQETNMVPDLTKLKQIWPENIKQISLEEGIARTLCYYKDLLKISEGV